MQSHMIDIDPKLHELLSGFIGQLPLRLAAIESAYETRDTSKLIVLVHQLAGAGGSYGFPNLSHAATTYEAALRNDEDQSVQGTAHRALFEACDQVVEAGAAGSMFNAS